MHGEREKIDALNCNDLFSCRVKLNANELTTSNKRILIDVKNANRVQYINK